MERGCETGPLERIEPAEGDKPRIAKGAHSGHSARPVAEQFAVERDGAAAGGPQNRIPGRRIPLHGIAEARIKIGSPGRDGTELEGGTRDKAPADAVAGDIGIGLRRRVRLARDHIDAVACGPNRGGAAQ